MAVTQVAATKQGISLVAQEDDDGYFYFTWGGIRFFIGGGTPHAIITAPLGSVYFETTTGAIYRKTSAADDTTWAVSSA